MKAQPKHLSCIAVAAFHLACMQHQKLQQEQQLPQPVVVPEPLDLVNISQSRCSPSDLLRMRAILGKKSWKQCEKMRNLLSVEKKFS